MTGRKSESVKSKSSSSKKRQKSQATDENVCPPELKKAKSKEENTKGTSPQEDRRKTFGTHLSCNILQYCRNNEMGFSCQKLRKPLRDSIIKYCKTFEVYKMESPFTRRVTFLQWHPTNPNLLAVTSHGGDFLLYNYEQDIRAASMIEGIGAGGSVQNMKFDPLNPQQIYAASMEGKFLVLNFETKEEKNFLETNDINRWYVSLDVNSNNNVMVAGDTCGGLAILTLDGQIVNTVQVHKKGFKVSHSEFSKREPWLLCTSSTDKTLKLWDIRSIKQNAKELAKPLQTIDHVKPVNAAYFSLTDGCRLLTTDQMDKIHVYRAPLWTLESTINHPHRQFQHLTPIRAYWHPFEDIVFIGRYPCKEFPGYQENELRTIDFFDAETGDLLYQHYQSGVNGILSLNRFNITGDALASSYGYRFIIWKPNFRRMEKASKKEDLFMRKKRKHDEDGDDSDGNDDDNPGDDPDDRVTIDWNKIMKKQAKEKKMLKGKKKES